MQKNPVAQLIENVMGGVGVAVLVLSLSVAFGAAVMAALPWAAIGGSVVFGVASTVRAFSDEWGKLLAIWAQKRNNDELTHLRAAVRHYEEQARAVPEDIPIYELANRALEEHYMGGMGLSYEAMRRRGYSRDQFDLLHSLFVRAGIKNEHGQILQSKLYDAQSVLNDAAASGTVWNVGPDGRVNSKAYLTAQ